MKLRITEEQHQHWREKGYLHVSQLLTPSRLSEIQGWVDEIGGWARESSDDLKSKGIHDFEETENGIRLTRSEFLIDFHDGLRDLLNHGDIPSVAGQLVGEAVVLYKEKINYKYPGGGGYAAHQDAPAFPHIAYSVTCAVAIDDANQENGCLSVAPGRHLEGLIHPNSEGCIEAEYASEMSWRAVEMQAGDALFFCCHLPHKSPANRSSNPRRSLYLTYNKLSEGERRRQYYEDKLQRLAMNNQDGVTNKLSLIGHFQGKKV